MPGTTVTRRWLCCAVVGMLALTFSGMRLVAAQTATQTPTQVYEAYQAALKKAKAYSELFPFIEARNRVMLERLPEATQAQLLGLAVKAQSAFTDIKVTGEKITGDTAVLTASGQDRIGQAATGIIPMTKEATGWKVGSERWSSKPGGH